MDTWFVRHSIGAINAEEHRRLFEAEKIAIHYPALNHRETDSLDPADYEPKSAQVIRRFAELAKLGGYIWAQYSSIGRVKIGVVDPGSHVEAWQTTWSNPRSEKGFGQPAILKTLPIAKSREIERGESMSLRVARPQQGTLCRWPKVKNRLKRLMSGESLTLDWRNLSSDQLETAVSEFLRTTTEPTLPQLRFLLLPPGRTMQDVDVYGVADDGRKIFAQVTYRAPQDRDPKLSRLESYAEEGSHALFFCNAKAIYQRDGVTVVPNKLVGEWLQSQEPFSRRFLDELD